MHQIFSILKIVIFYDGFEYGRCCWIVTSVAYFISRGLKDRSVKLQRLVHKYFITFVITSVWWDKESFEGSVKEFLVIVLPFSFLETTSLRNNNKNNNNNISCRISNDLLKRFMTFYIYMGKRMWPGWEHNPGYECSNGKPEMFCRLL